MTRKPRISNPIIHRTFLVLAICVWASTLFAQAPEYARENAQYSFPQTLQLRNDIAAADTALFAQVAYRKWLDGEIAVYDSIAQSTEPYMAYPIFHYSNKQLSRDASVRLFICADRAHPLYDSAMMLHSLFIQRNAMRVENVGGVIDLIAIPDQNVYRIHSLDSSSTFVQTGQPHHIGDTLRIYAVRFGRRIFPSPTDTDTWEMEEGGSTHHDNAFDVLRETPRPRIYDQYQQFSERFTQFRAHAEPPLDSAMITLRQQLQQDAATAETQFHADEDTVQALITRLWGMNMLLAAMQAADSGTFNSYLKSVDILLRMQAADSQFIAISAGALYNSRLTLDSIAHENFFGVNGLKSLALIPGGSVTLHTGEHYEPSAFFLDSTAVTNEEYNAFERITGYVAHGNWRVGFLTTAQNDDPVLGLTEVDKIVFARWADKRPSSPQEMEYVAASGYPTLVERNTHPTIQNLYGVALVQDGFYCARDISSLPKKLQDPLTRIATSRALEIQKIINEKK